MPQENSAVETCCPEFHPEQWDRKTLSWKEKRFAKGRVFTFFYMPIGFGRTMKHIVEKMEAAEVSSSTWMGLSDHTSPWNMDVLIDVDGPVPGLEMVELSGEYYCRIYDGPYNQTKKMCDDFHVEVTNQGKQVRKWYMWYVYCPKCAKKYGHNYVGVIGELESM